MICRITPLATSEAAGYVDLTGRGLKRPSSGTTAHPADLLEARKPPLTRRAALTDALTLVYSQSQN